MMLEGWYDSIKELAPEMALEDLKTIIDRMKVGAYQYDSRVGIQNIFKSYILIIDEKISTINSSITNNQLHGRYDSDLDEKTYKENTKKLDYLYEIKNRINNVGKSKPRVFN